MLNGIDWYVAGGHVHAVGDIRAQRNRYEVLLQAAEPRQQQCRYHTMQYIDLT